MSQIAAHLVYQAADAPRRARSGTGATYLADMEHRPNCDADSRLSDAEIIRLGGSIGSMRVALIVDQKG